MIGTFLIALSLFLGSSLSLSTTKLQLIPGLLNITNSQGSVFNAESCKDPWKYTLKLHNFDLVCSNFGECLYYEQLGYLFYFPPVTFDISGTYDELSKRFNNKTIWLNLRIEKENRSSSFHDYNFPIQIQWLEDPQDPRKDLNEFFDLEVVSRTPGRTTDATLSCSIYLICANHFSGNQCQNIDCKRQILPANAGWHRCYGSNQFEDVLESHYKQYRTRQSKSTTVSLPSDSSLFIEETEASDSQDLFANRNFVMAVVCILTVIALVESTIIFVYILKSFKRKSIIRR